MDIASNPGPTTTHDLHAGNDQNSNRYNIRCLYFNARSLSNKTKELQTLASNIDIIAVTETWLKPDILNCELLPGNDFAIHRQDRVGRSGGGVMLAVRNTMLSIRRKDLESENAEIVACEIRLESKKKFLFLAFYRPPNTDINHIKELKKSLHLAIKV
jgi:exonuclease III